DTLFAAGCGRLFEGTAAQMFASLQRLAALPAQTLVYCTHEYTLSNLRFAIAVEPGNPLVGERLEEVTRLREAGQISYAVCCLKKKNCTRLLGHPVVTSLAD